MTLCSFRSALEALDRVLEPLETERVPLVSAMGRVLAEELRSHRALPAVPVSAMDGYALRAEETRRANRDCPARLSRVGVSYAGHPAECAVAAGTTVRIFTGAPLPPGADAVVRQEAALEEKGHVSIFVEVPPGKDVRAPGEELAPGVVLGKVGERLEPTRLALIATQGHADVQVFRKPRVAVLATGDELVEPGQGAEPFHVYESNRVLVAAAMNGWGADLRSVSRSGDGAAELEGAIREVERLGVDLLVTTGGASVGERDRVKAVLSSLGGRFIFDGVALKPGKPVALARLERTWVLVLPGNPGAAQVALDQFGRRLVLGLQGTREQRATVRARLTEPRRKQGGLTYFVSARMETNAQGEPVAHLRPQGGQLLHALEADGYALLPSGLADLAAGDWVDVELFAGARWKGRGS